MSAAATATTIKDDMPKPVIVKVQRPLGGARDAPWYVYDENRSINQFVAVNDVPSSVVAAMGLNGKRYFYVVRDEIDGRLIFGKPCREAQSW